MRPARSSQLEYETNNALTCGARNQRECVRVSNGLDRQIDVQSGPMEVMWGWPLNF
jgi:hypothetical protein